jgi:hypothetical protein
METTCPVCGMVLLPTGNLQTSYNRQGGTNTNLTAIQAFSRVCQYHNKPECVNPTKSGPLEVLSADMPTTEGWLQRAAAIKDDIQH